MAMVLPMASTATANATSAAKQTYRIPTWNVPVAGSTYTDILGINNLGVMVGQYNDAAGNYHGFIESGKHFTSVDVPGAAMTAIQSINDQGTAVGWYLVNIQTGPEYGFVRSPSGVITTLYGPGTAGTSAQGINDFGEIVGQYPACSEPSPGGCLDYDWRGFTYDHGTYTTLSAPGYSGADQGTQATSINNFGEVAGSVYDCNLSGPPANSGCSTQSGFTLETRVPGAKYNYFIGAGDMGAPTAPPDAGGTYSQGINNLGAVVGHSNDQYFVGWEYANGKTITISDPQDSSSRVVRLLRRYRPRRD